MSKPKAILLNMPEERQAQLAEWLLGGMHYAPARVMLEKEFGVKVGQTALHEFWKTVCEPEVIRRRKRAAGAAQAVGEEARKSPSPFASATIDQIEQMAFEVSIDPNRDPDKVAKLCGLLLKVRDQNLELMKIEEKKAEAQRDERRLKLLEDRAAAAKAKLTEVKTRGGLSPETLQTIEEAAKLL